MDATAAGLVAVAIGQVATLVTFIANGYFTRRRETAKALREDELAARNRRWLIEDRAALAATLQAKVEATAATVAATAERTASALAVKVADDQRAAAAETRAHVDKIVGAVAVVGDKADAAFTEANSVNLKIEAYGAGLTELAKATKHEGSS
jgi:hypothetical protein